MSSTIFQGLLAGGGAEQAQKLPIPCWNPLESPSADLAYQVITVATQAESISEGAGPIWTQTMRREMARRFEYITNDIVLISAQRRLKLFRIACTGDLQHGKACLRSEPVRRLDS